MKKTLLAIVLCCTATLALAAQAPVTQIDKFNSAATKIDDVRVATNVRLAHAQSNFTELYTLLGGNPWLAQTTAPSIHNVFWLDTTGASPTIKYWDGDSWEVAAASGDETYTLPVASAEALGGVKVGERLTITDGVLSADVQSTDISGKQDTLVSGTNIKTVNSTSLLGAGNIDISGSSVSDGTVNGQVLLWATDQWVASIAPWLLKTSLGAGVEAALGFAPNTAGGFLLYSTYAADPFIKWDTTTITETEDSPTAGTNTIGVKSGVFQAYDSDWLGVTANGASLISAANYAAMKTLLDLEPGADYDAATPSTLNLASDTDITASQLLSNKFISNQGASGEVDITLPAVSYSITRTVLVEETQIAEINPPSGEAFDLSGTMLDASDCIDSPPVVGAKAVFTRMQDASGVWHWSVDQVRGTWVDTGASD